MESNNRYHWLLLLVTLGILFLADLLMGSVWVPPGEVLSMLVGGTATDPVRADILWLFRMPKALTCLLAGSGLALGGLQMQTLFRNALAGPDVLGLSSGASLLVSLLFMGQSLGLGLGRAPSPWVAATAAGLGSMAVFILMLGIAKRLKDNTSLLIVGLMIGAATASLVSILQYFSPAEEQRIFLLWTFGSLSRLNWTEIQALAAALVVGSFLAVRSTKALNAWLLGDHYAKSLGINLESSRIVVIASTSILTGAVTAFCGPIAFVGLAVPHLTRLVVNTNDHRMLIPAVLITGGIIMLFCDIAAQLPGSATVLPINAVTAMIGAPVVIWIVLRSKRVYL